MDRALIVAEARAWLGTPFHHQQAVRGVGCDCIGLVRGVMIATGLLPADFVQRADVQPYRGYGRLPDGRLMPALEQFLTRVPVDQAQAGDLVVVRFSQDPQHVGLLAEHPEGGLSLIHALDEVREHRLDARWQRRVIGAYRLEAPPPAGTPAYVNLADHADDE